MGSESQSPSPERTHRPQPPGLGGGSGAAAVVAAKNRTREGVHGHERGALGARIPALSAERTQPSISKTRHRAQNPDGTEFSSALGLPWGDLVPWQHAPRGQLCETRCTTTAPGLLHAGNRSIPARPADDSSLSRLASMPSARSDPQIAPPGLGTQRRAEPSWLQRERERGRDESL